MARKILVKTGLKLYKGINSNPHQLSDSKIEFLSLFEILLLIYNIISNWKICQDAQKIVWETEEVEANWLKYKSDLLSTEVPTNVLTTDWIPFFKMKPIITPIIETYFCHL